MGKGIDYYAYLGTTTGSFTVTFARPHDYSKRTQSYPLSAVGTMLMANTQLDVHDIDPDQRYGKFEWTADRSGDGLLTSGYVHINPITGNLGDSTAGDMGKMLSTPSQFGSDWALSYGFYDSGPGIDGLTNQDQSYVYLTADMSNWMGNLATTLGSTLTAQPFSVFALPGAHDSGMFDTTCVSTMLSNPVFLKELELGDAISTTNDKDIILRTVINLAFTQKDSITNMLTLGVRVL